MNNRLSEQNYYEILEVRSDAPQHEILEAYKRAKKTYSPDSPALYSMFTRDEAEELLDLIEEAFSILSNQNKRAEYDLVINTNNHANTSMSDDTVPEKHSEHLPDFKVPEPNENQKTPKDAKQSALPPKPEDKSKEVPLGFHRTKFSVYEINEGFEEEIKNCNYFDGTFLQKIRKYKGINLEQVSDETRISKTYLSNIESNNYSGLPAPVFVRGFVVQIAKVLHLDSQKVANSYMSILKKA